MSIIATPNLLITAAAATGEPLYNSGIHTSLFYDPVDSYATLAAMENGSGDNTWTIFDGSATPGVSQTGGPTGGGYFYNNYTATDQNHRYRLSADGPNPPEGGVTPYPDPLILTFWIKNTQNKFRAKIAYGYASQGDGPPATGQYRHVFAWAAPTYDTPRELTYTYWQEQWPNPPRTDISYRPAADIPSRGGVHLTTNQDGANGAARADDGWNNFGYLNWWYVPNANNTAITDWDEWGDSLWHRITYRITKVSGAFGGDTLAAGYDGRMEMWYDGVKIHDWIGDDPTRTEYQKVFMPGQTQRVFSYFEFSGPSAPSGIGGTFPQTVQYGDIRFFTVT